MERHGGADEIRTHDPRVANAMLYQLSYRPIALGCENGAEVTIAPPRKQAEKSGRKTAREGPLEPAAERVADGLAATECTDAGVDFAAEDYVTYKVVAVATDGAVSAGALHTCSRATDIEKDRYVLQAQNIGGKTVRREDLD